MTKQPSQPHAGFSKVVWLLLALPLVVVLGLAVLFSYIAWSSRNITFRVGPAGLEIQGSLYGRTIPRDALQVEQARVVNLATERSLALTRRTNGTGLPGYREGWFRLADDRKALVFLTETRQAVHLPTTQGYVVLLSPVRPEMFVAALQATAGAPQTFAIVPASGTTGLFLLLPAMLPLLLLAPLLIVAVQQRWAAPPEPSADALYSDRLVEITDTGILFRHYYFPVGAKRVAWEDVDRVEEMRPGMSRGSWRIWGTGDFLTWFPADFRRPGREAIFLLHRHGKRSRIGFTVEDTGTVRSLLRHKGLLRTPA